MKNESISKLTYLLACLAEECGEVQQMVGKSTRFGLLEIYPKAGKTNWLRLRAEVHDVVAMYEMLCDEFDRVDTLDRSLINKKKAKVLKYMRYSKELGVLDGET